MGVPRTCLEGWCGGCTDDGGVLCLGLEWTLGMGGGKCADGVDDAVDAMLEARRRHRGSCAEDPGRGRGTIGVSPPSASGTGGPKDVVLS